MSPTTREVEARRVERMRRRAEQLAANAAARKPPRTAAERRTARVEAAHAAATAPARWFCRVAGCAIADVAQPAASREAALEAADTHYNRRHYVAVPAWADDWQAAGRPRLDGWLPRWLAAHPDTPTMRGTA